MGKTSKKEQTQTIDPQMRAEAEAIYGLGHDIAGIGYTPYTGNTTAAFTPAQRQAFDMADAASSAFGMTGGASAGVTRGSEGAYGIEGFSPEKVMQRESPIPAETQAMLDAFFNNASTRTPTQPILQPSSGKK